MFFFQSLLVEVCMRASVLKWTYKIRSACTNEYALSPICLKCAVAPGLVENIHIFSAHHSILLFFHVRIFSFDTISISSISWCCYCYAHITHLNGQLVVPCPAWLYNYENHTRFCSRRFWYLSTGLWYDIHHESAIYV